ncbi:MAG TPA: ATP synthase F0 subunit A [Firmicutes bacterium]|nr:ATP synthase F0 subunit A [Bacillota bacterium]
MTYRSIFLALGIVAATLVGGPALAADPHGDDHSNTVDPIHHVVDANYLEIPWPNAHLAKKIYLPTLVTVHFTDDVQIELAITKHVVVMWIVAILLIVFVTGIGRKASADKAPTGTVNFLEVFVVWMRDNVTVPAMGPHWGRKLLPYFLTVFFFILSGNLFGLIPYSATFTGNLAVTAAMASTSFILIQAIAIREAGFGGWIKHLTAGVHPALWPIMIPVEFLGLFTKPFALAVRLFANMSAGHIVIVSLLGLIFIFGHVAVAGLSVPFAVFIYLLEILVAFIQAFIFTMLTAVFTGMGVHSHHAEAH